MTEKMSAWRRETYGPASGTRLEQVPVPVPARGEVVLRVHATALNAGDVRVMLGDPLLVRAVFGLRRPKQPIRGMDVAGTVTAVGPDVVGVEVGQQVLCELEGGGGLAEYARVQASRVVVRPSGVPIEVAASLPISGGTAWQALDLAGIGVDAAGSDGAESGASGPAGKPSRVLILGASGGVGTFAVQLAAQRGAEVWAACGERNRVLVESLGAARVFDHRKTPLTDLAADGFDAVIDLVGGTALSALRRLVAPGGSVVLVSGGGGRVLGPVPRMLKAALLSIGSRRPIRMLAATSRPEVLRALLALALDGRITAVIEREYPFARASAALAHVEAGHTVGKVVVRGS